MSGRGKLSRDRRQKADPQSRVMLTTSDVAQLLGLHPNTVRRWSKRGILKAYRISPRGDRRFRREEVYRFMAKGSCDIEFAECIRSKYPGVDEDLITMIKDILEHPPAGREERELK